MGQTTSFVERVPKPYDWKRIATLVYQDRPSNRENIILFAKNVTPDSCLLLYKNLIQLADVLVKNEGQGAFILGAGPGRGNQSPSLFSWQASPSGNGNWVACEITDVDELAKNLECQIGSQPYNVFYHLEADTNLDVTRILHIGTRNGDDPNTFTLVPVCAQLHRTVSESSPLAQSPIVATVSTPNVEPLPGNEESVTKRNEESVTTAGNWFKWYWLLILVLIVVVIWLTVRQASRV